MDASAVGALAAVFRILYAYNIIIPVTSVCADIYRVTHNVNETSIMADMTKLTTGKHELSCEVVQEMILFCNTRNYEQSYNSSQSLLSAVI